MKSLYSRLAISGIKRNKKVFMPFIGTIIFLIVLSSICLSLVLDKSLAGAKGMESMKIILFYGVIVLSIFSLIMLSSVYSFIQKGKLKEQGLYLILGLEKRHLRIILFWEIIFIIIFSIVPASIFSLVLYKLSLGIFVKLINIPINIFEGGLFNNFLAVAIIALIFIAILIFVFAIQNIKMRNYSPIDLVNESKAGEKKNKFTKLIALFGIIFIAGGYAISLSTKNPVQAFFKFFIAATLVIIGTYFAFSTIVTLFLEIVKNKRALYYKKENFLSVSGLLYRVNNNSRSLANIAILSTAFTIVLTSGISLYAGIGDVTNRLFPAPYALKTDAESLSIKNLEKYRNNIRSLLADNKIKGRVTTTYEWFIPLIRDKNKLRVMKNGELNGANLKNDIISLDIIYSPDTKLDFKGKDLIYFKEDNNEEFIKDLGFSARQVSNETIDIPLESVQTIFEKNKILAKDYETANKICEKLNYQGDTSKVRPDITTLIRGNLPKNFNNLFDEHKNEIKVNPNQKLTIIDRQQTKEEFLSDYGVIFFVGIILSLAFLITMGLAIYYKFLTEAYGDVERFKILRKLGLDEVDAKKIIRKQMAWLLFLPIVFCLIHTSFALPVLQKFLMLIGLMNTKLFIKSMIFVFLIYIIFYLVIYKFTEKIYIKIVLEK
ncbi:MAG: FtsX-like permease family protein [Peptoniphilus grossensis]|uniref:FtsX-like permease family protein n=1 Tax=Peptoniphilus grossensis TaxID=1465756 RepID=UPI00258D9252|nr:FtsX-like permease family protein [Peptoniphilus grossensis]MDU5099650.1 FtsX-like permease family protein [Peptoniphilus grossensis]